MSSNFKEFITIIVIFASLIFLAVSEKERIKLKNVECWEKTKRQECWE